MIAIDKVYVLSVKKYKNRIKNIKGELKKHNIDFEFIFDFDPENISKNELKNYDLKNLSIKHISLIKKHIKAWENAINKNYKNILVLEDDAILKKNFAHETNKILNEISKFNKGKLVFLGGADTKTPFSKLLTDKSIFENPIATTEGYITDIDACKTRIKSLKNALISLPADHLLKKIDSENKIKQYWSFRPLVEQGSVIGIFESELDKNRMKHSVLYNKLRYKWQKLRRRQLKTFLAILIYKFIKWNSEIN